MKYETYCLDEAAYLALRGYSVTVTRTGPVSALFSFKTDEHFNEARAGFWKGEESVLLHRWLATRAALKNECIGQARSAKHVPSPSIVPEPPEPASIVPASSRYWYHDANTVKAAMFGNRPPHTSRFAEGNFYPTREDAKLKRNARQVAGAT